MKHLLAILLFLAASSVLTAQEVLIDEQVTDSVVEPRFGPNYKHFVQTIYSFGFMLPSDNNPSAPKYVEYGFQFPVGFRYKYKIDNHLALGSDVYFKWTWFDFDTTRAGSVAYSTENYSLGAWGLAPYLRFNFGKRGNHLGTFVDIFAFGELNPVRSYEYRIESDMIDPILAGQNSLHKDVIYSKLNFIQKYSAGAGIRFGWKDFALFAQYRLTQLYLEDKAPAVLNHSEFPAFCFGLEFGM